MLLAIRADGSSEIGYGHLMRTSALARKFLEHGHGVTYLTGTHTEASEVCPSGANVHQLGDEDLSDTLGWLNENEPEILLTDSYDVDTEYQHRLHDVVPTLATITDDTRFTLCCDVNINGNAYAPELDYDWIGEKPEMFLGTDYLLMREEFRELADKTPPWHDPAKRALITFGGSDVNNVTPDAVRAFDGLGLDVDVIIGPGFENEDEIRDSVSETDAEFNVLRDPNNLPQRMFEADLAVSAAGSTIYELLAMGTPTVCAPQSDNQSPVAESLNDTVLRFDTNTIQNCLLRLTEDTSLRRKMRRDGMKIIDLEGTRRVYSALSI